jgi:Chaperone of endosialidase
MNPLIQLKKATLPFLGVFVLICLTLSPRVEAVVPPPDGGYSGFNTAEGQNALFSLTTGSANTSVGWYSLFSNTDGSFNTALGAGTLLFNVGDQSTGEGIGNTAIGAATLLFNTTGSDNTAIGEAALLSNTEGIYNTATGNSALQSNVTGIANTANGKWALLSNTTGSYNTANGVFALSSNTTGDGNTANGYNALNNNTTGARNVALGDTAGNNATTGNFNIYIGAGMVGVAGESNACYIASIFGQTSASGVPVYINSDNKLGTSTSSKRFKKDIKPMDKASEALLALKPVTFRYKKELDPGGRSPVRPCGRGSRERES